jgi:hypothetical protein
MNARSLLLFLTFTMVTGASAQPAAARARIKLESYRKTIAVRARVGSQEGLFALDTAGGLSLFTPSFAKRAGCKTWGRLTGFQMMGDRFDSPRCDDMKIEIGGERFSAPIVGVFDIMSLYPKGAEPIDGSLALDIFAGKAITIDFPGKLLTVESEKSLRARVGAKTAVEVPARIAREVQGHALAVSVGVKTAEGTVWMELDSGNGGTILVNKVYARLFGLNSSTEGPQKVSFELAKGLTVEGDAFAPDMVIDGNIGMPFLKKTVATFDLVSGRVWLAAAK